jgi:hypothetical protein
MTVGSTIQNTVQLGRNSHFGVNAKAFSAFPYTRMSSSSCWIPVLAIRLFLRILIDQKKHSNVAHVTVPGNESESDPTNLGPVSPYSFGSGLFGAGSDFFMHYILLNPEIEMNSVINSDPELSRERKPAPAAAISGPSLTAPAPTELGPDLRLRSRSRENWDCDML